MEKFNRRDFLKYAAIGSASALALALGYSPNQESDVAALGLVEADLPSGWGGFVDQEAKKIFWEKVYGSNFYEYVDDVESDSYGDWELHYVRSDVGLVGSGIGSEVTAGYKKKIIAKVSGEIRGKQYIDLGFTQIVIDGVDENNMMNCLDVMGNKIDCSLYAPTILSMLRCFRDGCELMVDVTVRSDVFPGNKVFSDNISFEEAANMGISRIDILFDRKDKKIPKPKHPSSNISDPNIGTPSAFYFVRSNNGDWWSSKYVEEKELKEGNL